MSLVVERTRGTNGDLVESERQHGPVPRDLRCDKEMKNGLAIRLDSFISAKRSNALSRCSTWLQNHLMRECSQTFALHALLGLYLLAPLTEGLAELDE